MSDQAYPERSLGLFLSFANITNQRILQFDLLKAMSNHPEKRVLVSSFLGCLFASKNQNNANNDSEYITDIERCSLIG